MKDFLIKVSIWSVIFCVMIISYGFFCDWFFSASKFLDDTDNKRAWCLKRSNENYDYAILGSSKAFGSFDIPLLNRLLNTKNINLGANGSGYTDNYLILYEFLKNHNSLKCLLLQVDIYSLNSKKSFSNAFHTYQFLPYWQDHTIREGVGKYLDRNEKILWSYFPPLRYFKYNKYFSPKEVIRRYKFKKNHSSPFDRTFGGPKNDSYLEENLQNTLKVKPSYRTLDSVDILYLSKIISLCINNKIKVVAYKAPEHVLNQAKVSNYKELNASVESIIQKYNIKYIHPIHNIETEMSNFIDLSHLTSAGRDIFTKSFAERLKLSEQR